VFQNIINKHLMDFTGAPLSQLFFSAKRDYPLVTWPSRQFHHIVIITRNAMYGENNRARYLLIDKQSLDFVRGKRETIARKRSRRDEELFRFDRLCVRIHIFRRFLTSLTLFIKLLINAMKDFNTTMPRLSRANELLP